MTIEEFEAQIQSLLTDDEGNLEESLRLYPHLDGCFGASFRGEAIPCEGRPWNEALDAIVEYIKQART